MDNISKENYLKHIYQLAEKLPPGEPVNLSNLTKSLNFKSASITNMLKKLEEDGFISYLPYKGVRLSELGRRYALLMIRKHRIWEYFLHETLHFDWAEVHEIAEQLEHIHSDKLIDQLEKFLNYPTNDPHGDPIPDKEGNFHSKKISKKLLSKLVKGERGLINQVVDSHPTLLNYLQELGISLNSEIQLLELIDFDESVKVKINEREAIISKKVSDSILVEVIDNSSFK